MIKITGDGIRVKVEQTDMRLVHRMQTVGSCIFEMSLEHFII